MGAGKHIPFRTCVVCGGKRYKFDMLRLALDAERWIIVDFNQCMGGRGAYVCPNCLPQLRLANRVRKAFRNQARGVAKNILQQSSILSGNGTG